MASIETNYYDALKRPDGRRIYCEGVQAQKGGAAEGTNPWPTSTDPASEFITWRNGHRDSAEGDVDLSMCGYPVAGAPAPEVSNREPPSP